MFLIYFKIQPKFYYRAYVIHYTTHTRKKYAII